MAELRVEWQSEYRPAGERGTSRRRRAAASIARTRTQSGRTGIGGRGLTGLRGLERTVEPVIPLVQVAAEKAALEALIGPKSMWPVDTGFSIAGFYFIGRGEDAVLSNRADYAQTVEERTGAATATLEAAAEDIAAAADAAASEALGG